MRDISAILNRACKAKSAVVVPGSGTYGMEAVTRQFATGKKCVVIRAGWLSYRWTRILDTGGIPSETTVVKARRRSKRSSPRSPRPGRTKMLVR
jgi:aspartate aminotransferase-like enzyme